MLQNYFRSGWAFLIPYLAAYLLYAWLKWPVNPVAAGSSPVDGGQLAVSAIGALPSTGTPSTAWSSPPFTFTLTSLVPPLLHVYWFLHALHLVLGALALRAWWKESGATVTGATDDSENTANHSATSQPSTDNRSPATVPQSGHRPPSAMDRLWAAMPWLCLAMLICIPGVYLEMPSDPWSHFSRINQWSNVTTVLENSDWMKSGSFLAYSLVGWVTSPLGQLKGLDIFYTACGLLYCWQYFRLARTLRFSAPHAFIAVLLNFLLFGNNIFGFQRYYGMSTTILAQIGVLALSRGMIVRSLPPSGRISNSISRNPAQAKKTCGLSTIGFFVTALGLIGMNHIQGLAIAGISAGGILCWHVTNVAGRKAVWIVAGVLLVNVLVVCLWPQHPILDAVYRPGGWLTAWHGFDILSPNSPAGNRAIQIFGLLGVVNLIAGAWLMTKRSVIGWLTVAPVLLLLSPAFTIPFADAVARFGPPGYDYMITFNRFLLAIPAGLALCLLIPELLTSLTRVSSTAVSPGEASRLKSFAFPGLLAGLTFFVLLPASQPFFNRFWHQFMKVPNDLAENHVTQIARSNLFAAPNRVTGFPSETSGPAVAQSPPDILSTPGVGFVISSFGERSVVFRNKWMTYPSLSTPIDRIQYLELAIIEHVQTKQPAVLVVPPYTALSSPHSLAGFLSGHWLVHQVALEQTGGPEIEKRILVSSHHMREVNGIELYDLP